MTQILCECGCGTPFHPKHRRHLYVRGHRRASDLEEAAQVRLVRHRRGMRAELLAIQGGKCGICGTIEPTTQGWHADHDHVTGRMRGVLCSRCNCLIGFAEKTADPVVTLGRAIAYLARPPAPEHLAAVPAPVKREKAAQRSCSDCGVPISRLNQRGCCMSCWRSRPEQVETRDARRLANAERSLNRYYADEAYREDTKRRARERYRRERDGRLQ